MKKPTERQKRALRVLKVKDAEIESVEKQLARLLESRRELINREGLNKLEGFKND